MIVAAVLVYPGPSWATIPAPEVPASAVGRPHWNRRKRELYVVLRGEAIEDVVDEAIEMWEKLNRGPL